MAILKVMIKLSGINTLQLGNNTQKVKQRFTKKCGNTLRSKVIKRTPVDHGQLRKSWDLTITEKEVILQNNKEYAMYVETGTGLYGPRKAPIFPKSAPFLQFEIDGEIIRCLSTKGMKGVHMAEKGVNDLEKELPNLLQQSITEVIQ